MFDCVIIGGGVIGLSLAGELARRLRRVCVLDRAEPGRAASWAGAGMLPPASPTSTDPVEKFCHTANLLHAEWAVRLRAETGIDTGYRRTGAVYIARNESAAAELQATARQSAIGGVRFLAIEPNDLRRLAPALDASSLTAAYHAPDECQLRNPWHLKALLEDCRKLGVMILANSPAVEIETQGSTIVAVHTPHETLRAEQFCITSGAWSAGLTEKLRLRLPLKPIRGQIALLKLPTPLAAPIVNEGPRYLVPREDGRVLVGSTMEDVGFDTGTTPAAIDELIRFARALAPTLADAELEASWAGLRPASHDGWPYLGRLPAFSNGFLAAGHTRSGLHLSPATAVVMAELMSGEATSLDLSPFRIDRHDRCQPAAGGVAS